MEKPTKTLPCPKCAKLCASQWAVAHHIRAKHGRLEEKKYIKANWGRMEDNILNLGGVIVIRPEGTEHD